MLALVKGKNTLAFHAAVKKINKHGCKCFIKIKTEAPRLLKTPPAVGERGKLGKRNWGEEPCGEN